jgi:hypothetical protein
MEQTPNDLAIPTSWKHYLIIGLKFLGVFYISSFCLALFFMHKMVHEWGLSIFMISLYLFILVISLRKMIKQLPMAVLVLASPLIPLFMLIILVTMIPILENLV